MFKFEDKLMTTGVANKFKTDDKAIEVMDMFCLSGSIINRKQYQQFRNIPQTSTQ